MRVGLLIDPIDPALSYMENLEKASELGFDVVQLWYKDAVTKVEGGALGLAKALEGLGLELKSLAAYTDILDPQKPWAETFDFLKRAIRYAADAGTRFVVTESGGFPGMLDEWGTLVERLREVVRAARGAGVTILVENGPGVLVSDTALMLRMMEEVGPESFGINFDPANLNLTPGDVVEAVEKLGAFIRDTHAKDSILLREGVGGVGASAGSVSGGAGPGAGRSVPEEHIFVIPEGEDFIHIPKGVRWALPPIGEGDVPFPEYLAALRRKGFGGDLIIEYQGGGDREYAIVSGREYLKRALAAI